MKKIVKATENGDVFVCKCKNYRVFNKIKKSLAGFGSEHFYLVSI